MSGTTQIHNGIHNPTRLFRSVIYIRHPPECLGFRELAEVPSLAA